MMFEVKGKIVRVNENKAITKEKRVNDNCKSNARRRFIHSRDRRRYRIGVFFGLLRFI